MPGIDRQRGKVESLGVLQPALLVQRLCLSELARFDARVAQG